MLAPVQRLSEWTGLAPGVIWVLGAVYAGLAVGTIVRLTQLHRLSEETGRSLALRVRTWWVIAVVVGVAVLLGTTATLALLCVVSVLAMREYLSLSPDHRRYGPIAGLVYAVVVLQHLWIYLQHAELSLTFVPVIAFVGITTAIVLERQPEGFVRMAGGLQWGLLLFVLCLSHAAMLLTMPPAPNPVGGPIGWFLYVLVLTELNDIAQALFGRRFGRHKVIPEVSPGKSWEGLFGGIVCTVILAVLLGPVLTPLGTPPPRMDGLAGGWPALLSPWSALAGLLIGVSGFCGDIAVSSLKRDVHVKDSGTILPGQGGILDRVDSLAFAAPLFFHYVQALYG